MTLRYVSRPCGVYGRQEVALSPKCARWTPLYAVTVSSDKCRWSFATATPPLVWAGGRVDNIDTISELTEIDIKQRVFNPLKIYGLI